ncbi:MAG: hypothetical protein ABI699_01725 [Caldimonas sp.]
MAVAAPVSSLLQASSEPAHGRAPDPAAPPPFVRAVARVAVRDPSDAGMHASGTASRPRAAAPQLHIGAIAITVKAPPPPSPAAPPVAAAAAPRARDGFAFSASRHHLRWS